MDDFFGDLRGFLDALGVERGHLVHETRPMEFAGAVPEFLARILRSTQGPPRAGSCWSAAPRPPGCVRSRRVRRAQQWSAFPPGDRWRCAASTTLRGSLQPARRVPGQHPARPLGLEAPPGFPAAAPCPGDRAAG
ncbi:hypothetical protein IHE61_18330 [Streptomyces sp. GKU 257-1]|nr:hypothetical protein [Streptomyces sp. GKU 257-1]